MEFLYNDCTADKWCLITEIVNVYIKCKFANHNPHPSKKKNLTTKNPKKQKPQIHVLDIYVYYKCQYLSYL